MARAVAPHLMLCRALCSCATSRRPSLDTILAGSAREAESFCSGFARASRTPLGREADVAAVREAIRQYTHDTGFIAEIRWVSKTRVIADVVQNPYFNLGITNYCCLASGRPMHNGTRTRPSEDIAPILQSVAGKRSGARPRIPAQSGGKGANPFAFGGPGICAHRHDT